MTVQNQRVIFISYSHDDALFVNSFASLLLSFDLQVWKDSKDIPIGGHIPKTIYEGIKRASHFCCIISASSIRSAWVKEELSLAKTRQIKDRNLRIVPVLIDEVEIPGYFKAYLSAHLENRDLSIKNPELLKILKAFDIDLEQYTREMITGRDRKFLLEHCARLQGDLQLFREMFANFQSAYLEYESAISNKGYDRPEAEMPYIPSAPYRYSPPTTYGSDYRIEQARKGAAAVLNSLKRYAADVHAATQLLLQAWEKVAPSSSISQLHPQLYFDLDLLSYMSKTISESPDNEPDDWWVQDKLSSWAKEVPRIEASVEGAIALLRSWANFDPV